MQRTRIKFCGITRPQDAAAAAAAGADAIGINFHAASGRNVTIDRAKEILAALPPFVTPVGLFVDSSVEEIKTIALELNLRYVQLHGREHPATVAALARFDVIKVFHIQPQTLEPGLADWRRAMMQYSLSHVRGILLDTASTTAAGGTGIENHWTAIADAQQNGLLDGLPPLIAAGGLTPGNVGAVVRQLRPWAVDLSSGIEATRGVKSVDKMDAFVAAVRNADAG